eukprot:Hpha_TRINITY_DN16680_c2_g26::TRINITY_DN16680_c2_g26_i1::g.182493::m.182493
MPRSVSPPRHPPPQRTVRPEARCPVSCAALPTDIPSKRPVRASPSPSGASGPSPRFSMPDAPPPPTSVAWSEPATRWERAASGSVVSDLEALKARNCALRRQRGRALDALFAGQRRGACALAQLRCLRLLERAWERLRAYSIFRRALRRFAPLDNPPPRPKSAPEPPPSPPRVPLPPEISRHRTLSPPTRLPHSAPHQPSYDGTAAHALALERTLAERDAEVAALQAELRQRMVAVDRLLVGTRRGRSAAAWVGSGRRERG